MDSVEIFKIKKKIDELKKYRGSGTQLVSVYVPAKYPIPEVSGKIREEINQASNIKSKQTRTNVISSLERIVAALKNFRETPPNGLIIFAGNIADDPSKTDIKTIVLEPPFRLSISVYKCDSAFFTEPVEKMIESTDAYGIVVMDGREATLAILRGTQVDILRKLNSTAHAKVRKGGQSARRYERLIEESIEKYYTRIGEAMDEIFLGKTKGVIVGGPGPAKENFMKSNTYNYQIKVLGVIDTGYTDESGVYEVLSRTNEILAEQEAIREKQIVERFLKEVMRGTLATYGLKEVTDSITTNRADTVLVSEGLQYIHRKYMCSSCKNEWERIMRNDERKEDENCPKCNSKSYEEEEESLTEHLIELAELHKVKVEVISTKTPEGSQFLHGFAGIGAMLRY